MIPRLNHILIREALDVTKIQDHTVIRFARVMGYTTS
jgi:hypothetical protein